MNRLKEILRERGLTMERLSKELDVTVVTVQNWCANRTQPKWPQQVDNICYVLDIKPEELKEPKKEEV